MSATDDSGGEPPEWFTDLPSSMQQTFVSLGLVPQSWAPESLTGYGAPPWTVVPSMLGYMGFLSPIGLGPSYVMSALQRGMRAGWFGDYGEWMYSTRQTEALSTAFGYETRRPTPYNVGMAELYQARASYWGFQQAATPAYEAWSSLKLASYFSPGMWGIRGLGFPFWQFGTQVAAGAAMTPHVAAALTADPGLLSKVQTQAMFWPYQYPGAISALYHGGIEWSFLQVAAWALTGGGVGRTFRQAGPVSLLQFGAGLLAPVAATAVNRAMIGQSLVYPGEEWNVGLQVGMGVASTGAGLAWGLRQGFGLLGRVPTMTLEEAAVLGRMGLTQLSPTVDVIAAQVAQARGIGWNYLRQDVQQLGLDTFLGQPTEVSRVTQRLVTGYRGLETGLRLGLGATGWFAGGFVGWQTPEIMAAMGAPAPQWAETPIRLGVSTAMAMSWGSAAARAAPWLAEQLAPMLGSRIVSALGGLAPTLGLLGPIGIMVATEQMYAAIEDPRSAATRVAYQTLNPLVPMSPSLRYNAPQGAGGEIWLNPRMQGPGLGLTYPAYSPQYERPTIGITPWEYYQMSGLNVILRQTENLVGEGVSWWQRTWGGYAPQYERPTIPAPTIQQEMMRQQAVNYYGTVGGTARERREYLGWGGVVPEWPSVTAGNMWAGYNYLTGSQWGSATAYIDWAKTKPGDNYYLDKFRGTWYRIKDDRSVEVAYQYAAPDWAHQNIRDYFTALRGWGETFANPREAIAELVSQGLSYEQAWAMIHNPLGGGGHAPRTFGSPTIQQMAGLAGSLRAAGYTTYAQITAQLSMPGVAYNDWVKYIVTRLAMGATPISLEYEFGMEQTYRMFGRIGHVEWQDVTLEGARPRGWGQTMNIPVWVWDEWDTSVWKTPSNLFEHAWVGDYSALSEKEQTATWYGAYTYLPTLEEEIGQLGGTYGDDDVLELVNDGLGDAVAEFWSRRFAESG